MDEVTDDERPLSEESNRSLAQLVAMQAPSAELAAWIAQQEEARTDGATITWLVCMRCQRQSSRDDALTWGRMEDGAFVCGLTFPTCRSAPAPITLDETIGDAVNREPWTR